MVLYAAPMEVLSRREGGGWKHIHGCWQLLEDMGTPFRRIRFSAEEPLGLADGITEDCRHLIMPYTFWPEAVEEARRRFPSLRVHVQTVNAEPLQHLHRNPLSPRHGVRSLRTLWGMLRLGWRDSRCRRGAHTLLGISAWDDSHYWRRLPGGARIEWMPYFSPWPRLLPDVKPLPWDRRDRSVVCMPGQLDRIGHLSASRFSALADALSRVFPADSWRFLLTPGIVQTEEKPATSARVTLLPAIDGPWQLLCRSRAVAVLTHLGFGMKTTIVDALAAGCHVLVNPRLLRRLPDEVAKACLPCDASDNTRWKAIAKSLEARPRPHSVNEHLRERARSALARALRMSPC